MLDCYS